MQKLKGGSKTHAPEQQKLLISLIDITRKPEEYFQKQ